MNRQKLRGLGTSSLLYTHAGVVGDDSELEATAHTAPGVVAGRSIVLEKCRLDRSRFIHAHGIRIHTATLETVDAANAVLDESGWKNVLVKDSRWTGAHLNFAHLADVTFENCQMMHVQVQEAKLTNTRFEGCDLGGAYFNGTAMEGTVFEGSNLTGADFTRAQISVCDFRRANIEDIRIAPEQLRGVIVTQDQAVYLARLLGLDIRE